MSKKDKYEFMLKHLSRPVLIPLAIIVLIDYVQLLSTLVKVCIVFYVLTQAAGFIIGFWIAAATKLNENYAYKDVFKFKLCSLIPTIFVGKNLFNWAVSDGGDHGVS